MKNIHLTQEGLEGNFLPLTLNRAFTDLRLGILSINKKWLQLAKIQSVDLGIQGDASVNAITVNASFVPKPTLDLLQFLSEGKGQDEHFYSIATPWDLLYHLPQLIQDDLQLIGAVNADAMPPGVQQWGSGCCHIAHTATLEPCFINTEGGAVFIDEGARIMAGSMLRGPLYIGKNSVIKMGTALYAGTVVGDNCILGGEVKNSIILDNSNKAHHGYLGDSYIGEWCNLGAGTSCSNLKNTAGTIGVWSMGKKRFEKASDKLGIIMGDHVRTAVNTQFNSGTVIGSFSNIFNTGFLSMKYYPPFSWGGENTASYRIDKLLVDVERWMKMKNQQPTPTYIEQIKELHKRYTA
ncbi:MAG: hypothetical protein RIQ50_1253 [Bacteroidota bacterium]